MRKLCFLYFILGSCAAFGQINIPDASPLATISQKIGRANVSVEYSRPSAKGRMVFENLVPFDKVWRTGANKVTNLTFDQPLKINGSVIKPGTYALLTKPGSSEWRIILNRDAEAWGAYTYDTTNDVISFSVSPMYLDHNEPQMKIEFVEFTPTSAFLQISWERTAVKFELAQDLKGTILEEIKEEMGKTTINTSNFYKAASYYNEQEYELETALSWAKEAVKAAPKYWNYELASSIASKMGECELAIQYAEISLKQAQEAGDQAFVLLNKKNLAVCGKY